MKKVIHVNQHVIRDNKKHDKRNPPITVKTYKDNIYTEYVEILDKDGDVVAKIFYQPDEPLSCGAHVWIETHAKVRTKEGQI